MSRRGPVPGRWRRCGPARLSRSRRRRARAGGRPNPCTRSARTPAARRGTGAAGVGLGAPRGMDAARVLLSLATGRRRWDVTGRARRERPRHCRTRSRKSKPPGRQRRPARTAYDGKTFSNQLPAHPSAIVTNPPRAQQVRRGRGSRQEHQAAAATGKTRNLQGVEQQRRDLVQPAGAPRVDAELVDAKFVVGALVCGQTHRAATTCGDDASAVAEPLPARRGEAATPKQAAQLGRCQAGRVGAHHSHLHRARLRRRALLQVGLHGP